MEGLLSRTVWSHCHRCDEPATKPDINQENAGQA
jgi:hypothetical protein